MKAADERVARTPVVDRIFPLTDTADVITHLENGRTRGKIAITVDTGERR